MFQGFSKILQEMHLVLAIFLFGAALPFFVSGYLHHKNDWQMVELDIRPPVLVDCGDWRDRETLHICAEIEDMGRPKYSQMILDLQAKNENNIRFFNGQSGIWANIVLMTGICIAQWCSGAFVYYLKNDIGKATDVIHINILMALSCLLLLLFPSIGNIFYYILPIPVLIAWALYGLSYNWIYCIWHYCGVFLIFNLIWQADAVVQWLP